jgi:hypothetical protein
MEPFVGEFYHDRVTRCLEAVSPLLPGPGLRSELEAFFLKTLHGIRLPRGVEHGDFGHHNILTEGGHVTGLVDWETASAAGIPLLDALNYVEAAERIDRQQSLGDTIPSLARARWSNASEWAFLEREYRRWGTDLEHHESLVYLYWLQHVSRLVPYGLAYNASRVKTNVVAVAQQILGS